MANQETWDFVRLHREDDVRRLALSAPRHGEVDVAWALQQIAGWQTARTKLPSWAAIDGIVYPPHLNMEQCSSEQAARYKARLAVRLLAARPTAEVHAPTESEFQVLFSNFLRYFCNVFDIFRVTCEKISGKY